MKPRLYEHQIREGDPSKRGKHVLQARLNATVKASGGIPNPPAHLKGIARETWDFWKPELEAMDIDARPDALAFEAACIAYATSVAAHKKVEELGLVIEIPVHKQGTKQVVGTRYRRNPYVLIRERAYLLLLRFCSEFGFTPVARQRMSVEKPNQSAQELDALLSKPRAPRPAPKVQ